MEIRIQVVKARGLINRDWGFAGKSDPYVIVYDPDGKNCLKTATIDNCLDPDFPPTTSAVTVAVPDRGSASNAWSSEKAFRFCVWNENPVSDDFLGEAEVSMASWQAPGTANYTLTLKPRAGEKDKDVLKAASLGTLTVTVTWPAKPAPRPPSNETNAKPQASKPAVAPTTGSIPAAAANVQPAAPIVSPTPVVTPAPAPAARPASRDTVQARMVAS